MLSVVIPTLNAASVLAATLGSARIAADEMIVVDGGSRDETRAIAGRHGALVLASGPGRGRQLAAGIAAARGDWLLLLHADTILSADWAARAAVFMAAESGQAGYFRFRLNTADPRARRLENLVAWRCRVLALPYGDQGLLLPSALLRRIGGMRPLPLMEDVDLIRRLGRARLMALDADALTSAARWERDGYRARSARNLACLSLYYMGAPIGWIARLYG